MRLGIFAKTFARPTVEDVFAAVHGHRLECVQFNYACAGLPSLPDSIDPDLPRRVSRAAISNGLAIVALSGTFNMIHPDPTRRRRDRDRFGALAATCGALGTSIITLCSGTRDPQDMWRFHPDNATEDAWRDLKETARRLLDLAEEYQLTLAIEPEQGNVVSSATLARKLLDELQSPRLGIVMDPANLVPRGEIQPQPKILDEAFELLSRDIVLAHAKEWSRDQGAGGLAPGQGLLDWSDYLLRLKTAGFHGALILHGFEEKDAAAGIRLLRDLLGRSVGTNQ